MSEQDRAPHIRVQVDQEVFLEQVRDGDVIEDATVATEVTSFDKIGDAYVLEGAIVFVGYVRRSSLADGRQTGELGDVLSEEFGDGQQVEHVHHRMPFVLRVPTKSQPRGIVNVASRISSWKLEVISANWIRVLADLTVTGLNRQHGYHFHCGAQEEGDLFFEETTHADVSATDASQAHDTLRVPHATMDEQMLRGEEVANSYEDESFSEVRRVTDAISESRGGHPLHFPRESEETSARDELKGLDRAFEGSLDQPWSDNDQLNERTVPDEEPGGANAPKDVSPSDTDRSWAEFEFVHQVPNDELVERMEERESTGESFIPSRSFTDEGFHPGTAFQSSIQHHKTQDGSTRPSVDDTFAGHADVSTEDTFENDSEPGLRGERIGSELWSFVDFHAPEPLYTLRFVVVMEEDTLDTIAERTGCSRSEISRANRLIVDEVYPGQTLLIPSTKHVHSR